MYKTVFYQLLLLLLVLLPSNSQSLSLYGINLEEANAQQLRLAVKQAGARIISEGGADKWFDEYKSEKLLDGSMVLYLGFSKQNQQFAFLEYEIKPTAKDQVFQKMVYKYGQPQIIGGQFISDTQYQWQKGSITINWYYDFFNHVYRLIYSKADTLNALINKRNNWLKKQQEKELAKQDYAY